MNACKSVAEGRVEETWPVEVTNGPKIEALRPGVLGENPRPLDSDI
jgi:hypothetical protein